jgi:hypothetical protein
MNLKTTNDNLNAKKLDTINIENLVKNGEAGNLLTNIAKEMLEDLTKFQLHSEEKKDEFNSLVNNMMHQFLKYSCNLFLLTLAQHKINIDSLVVERNDMDNKLKVLNALREQLK